MNNNYADLDVMPVLSRDAEASGTPAIVTIAADPEEFWAIDWIAWSYAGTPTNGNLQVTINGVVVFSIDITAGGPGIFQFNRALYTGVKNQEVVITLADGGVANKVNVRYR